jgi:hypothetical protein
MKQLKPEHIAPYLPYEIKVKGKNSNEIAEVQSLSPNVNGLKLTNNRYHEDIENFVLVLRPLSDLTKEIEYGDESFIPLEYLKEKVSVCDAERDFLDFYEDNKNPDKIKFAPYTIMQKLFEWHIDVFELIDEGLAVDYNDV